MRRPVVPSNRFSAFGRVDRQSAERSAVAEHDVEPVDVDTVIGVDSG